MKKQTSLIKSCLIAVVIIAIAGLFVYATQQKTEDRSKAANVVGIDCTAKCQPWQSNSNKTLYTACLDTCRRALPPSPSPTVKGPSGNPATQGNDCQRGCMGFAVTPNEYNTCISKCTGLPPATGAPVVSTTPRATPTPDKSMICQGQCGAYNSTSAAYKTCYMTCMSPTPTPTPNPNIKPTPKGTPAQQR